MSGFVEVLQRLFGHVRNVARDFLWPKFRIARRDLELLDVDRGEDVGGDDALRKQDRVLEIVALPRHERDQHILTERQIAKIGRRAVRDDVAPLDPVAHAHQRPLVDAGVLVRALELAQIVDIDARFRRIGFIGGTNHDAGRIDLVDHSGTLRRDGCA